MAAKPKGRYVETTYLLRFCQAFTAFLMLKSIHFLRFQRTKNMAALRISSQAMAIHIPTSPQPSIMPKT